MELRHIHSPSWACQPIECFNRSEIAPSVRPRQERLWGNLNRPEKTIEIADIRDCWVAARGLVFDRDKRLLAQSVGVHTEVSEAQAAINQVAEANIYLSGPHALLKRPGSSCYGHWLVEILPTLHILQSNVDGPFKVLVQRLNGGMRVVQHTTLRALGVKFEDIVETRTAIYGVERLHAVFGATETEKDTSPLIVETFSQISSKAEPGPHKKIFIERPPNGTRSILNANSVKALMISNGFHVVRPETLSFDDQVALFKGADVVIGITGSALTNVVFCKPGTKVLALAPEPILDAFYWSLCNVLGHEYREVRFPIEPTGTQRLLYDEPLVVSLTDLRQIIRDL